MNSEGVNPSDVHERAVQACPIKAQSAVVAPATASICNAEWVRLHGTSGHGGWVHTFSRRQFVRGLSYAGVAMLVAGRARAADAPMVDEKDATAMQLGYVADATKADKAKYPNFKAGQDCATCQLYQGKAGSTSGPCPLFTGKQVAAKGWCSAFVKKA